MGPDLHCFGILQFTVCSSWTEGGRGGLPTEGEKLQWFKQNQNKVTLAKIILILGLV